MPYSDYHGFGEAYYEGSSVDSPHPAGYSNYNRSLLPWDSYAKKMHDALVSTSIDPSNAKVLVVGCAYGYTVEYLIDDWGVDSYGMDVSSYAVTQADSETSHGNRIFQGDVTVEADLRSVRKATPGGKFDVVFGECVLTCLMDAEAQTAVSNMRNEATELALHRVYTVDGIGVNSELYNSHTLVEWQALCDPDGVDSWHMEAGFRDN